MSASSMATAAADPQLQRRVRALAHKEAIYDEALGDSWFGRQLQGATGAFGDPAAPLYWPVAVATEAAYETALTAGRGAPGHDVDVITDAAITSAIIEHWPDDPTVPLPPINDPPAGE